MGVVHLAQRDGGARVALKVMRPHIVGDEEARRRLAQEVGSLGRIRSRWVAEIVDADPWAEVPYVATRYVPGLSLHDHVGREGAITGGDLLWFAGCLAEGLAAVHGAGVLHRDVKPSNVLLEGRTPILIDFGLARGRRRPAPHPHRLAARDAGLPGPRDPLRRRRLAGVRPALVGRHGGVRRDRPPAVRPRPVDGRDGPGPPRRARPGRAGRDRSGTSSSRPSTPSRHAGRRWTPSSRGCARRPRDRRRCSLHLRRPCPRRPHPSAVTRSTTRSSSSRP